MSNATLPERKRKKERTGQSRISSPSAPTGVSWTPEISEEDKQRNYFRLSMRNAFVARPSTVQESLVRSEEVLSTIFAWCQRNSDKILGCWVVIRGHEIEVLVFKPLQPFDEVFADRVSSFGVELTQLGIYSSVTLIPVDLEAGEKVGDHDYTNGDSGMVIPVLQ